MKRNILFLVVTGLLVTATVFAQKSTGTKSVQPPPYRFYENLIKNGNAETGNGEPWSNGDELKTILYGEFGGGPSASSAGPADRGEKYFYARTTTEKPVVVFTQKIDVSEVAARIDRGDLGYEFGAWFGVANGSSSAGRLKLTFLDAAGKPLKQDHTAEIIEENRPVDEVLIEKSGKGDLPPETRKIEVALEFKIFAGHEEKQDNLAFVDNMWMTLIEKKK